MHHALIPTTLYDVKLKWNRPYVVLDVQLSAWFKATIPTKIFHSMADGCIVSFASEADLRAAENIWDFTPLSTLPPKSRKRGVSFERFPVEIH